MEGKKEMGSYKFCLIFTRKFRMTESGPVEDVRDLFEKYTEGDAHMSPEQLQKLMTEEGGEGETSLEEAERIVDEVLRRKHHIAKFTRRNLTLDDFNYYLFSTDLNPPIADQVYKFFKSNSFFFFCSWEEKSETFWNLGFDGVCFLIKIEIERLRL
jgi:phosphatidylinositol phospholipase C delta